MRGTGRRAALAATALLVLTGCTEGGGAGRSGAPTATTSVSATPSVTASEPATTTGDWSQPGLVDRDGEDHEVPLPELGGGEVLDVTDFGADPRPGSGDDAEAVRDAIAAAQPGDEVHLPEGVYDLTTSAPGRDPANLLLRSSVDLRGDGAGVTVLRTSYDGEEGSAVVLGVAVEDVAVRGLTVTSTYDGPLGSDPDEETGGGPDFGVRIGERDGTGSSRVLLEDVHVERFRRHGISVKASREVTVRGCHVADATSVGPGGAGYGIAVQGRVGQRDPDADDDSRHNVVVGNLLDGEHLRHGIVLQFATHNNLVSDNVVEGVVLDAIELRGEGEYLNEIRGNAVSAAGRAGVALGDGAGPAARHGASGEGNWVHRNALRDNDVGVSVSGGTPGTRIEDNTVVAGSWSTAGIDLDDAPRTLVEGNTIIGDGAFVPLQALRPGQVEAYDNRVSGGQGP